MGSNLKDLSPNPRNPRRISDEKLGMLKKSILEFGDLGGIVFNETTGRLIGGHQRQKVLPETAEIEIEKQYHEPTRTGTVAEGYVSVDGERYSFRKVRWPEEREKAANIAANKHGGEWELPILSEWLLELDAMNMDMDLTGFDSLELENMMAPVRQMEPGEAKNTSTEVDLNSFDNFEHNCPKCGFGWNDV